MYVLYWNTRKTTIDCHVIIYHIMIIDMCSTGILTDPGKASEQYPGNPGHVVRAEVVDDVNHRLDATNPARDIVSVRSVFLHPSFAFVCSLSPLHN